MISIQLNEQEAELFKRFRQMQAVFEIFMRGGVFNVRNGSVEIHFNSAGDVGMIRKHESISMKT